MDKVKQNLPLLAVLCLAFIAMLCFITHSGLWFDEIVEYYYSKVIIGFVPNEETSNMYERIISTYQPPLYNVVMYIWLLIYDSEAWFRLFGVLITLLGGIGIYRTIMTITKKNRNWATMTTLIYLFLPCVTRYALECAEYNLMLAAVAWSTYFYVQCLYRSKTMDFIGLTIAAVISIYSQYGAILVECMMFFSLFVIFIRNKNWKAFKTLTMACIVSLIIAGLPLLHYFLIPQMEHQGSIDVDHGFVFRCPLFIVDIIKSPFILVSFVFNYEPKFGLIIMTLACALLVGVSLFSKTAESAKVVALTFMATLCIYYLLLAKSYYGYNDWKGTLGTYNIGGRYSLFMVPIFVATCSIGAKSLYDIIRKRRKLFSLGVGMICCGIFALSIRSMAEIKWNVREAVSVLIEKGNTNIPIVTTNLEVLGVHYYLSQNRPIDLHWTTRFFNIREAFEYDEIVKSLTEKGLLDDVEFNLFASRRSPYCNEKTLLKVLEDYGYTYNKLYGNGISLYHVHRNDIND